MDCLEKLEKASSNLGFASDQIQSAFEKASSKTLPTVCGEEIPDPVDVLNRIALMESSINRLLGECEELNRLRPVLAEQTTSLLLRNFGAIKELSTLVKGRHNAMMHDATEDLAQRTKQQHFYWDNERCSGDVDETDQNRLIHQFLNRQPTNSSSDLKIEGKSPSLKVHQNLEEGTTRIELSDSDFYSIPESIRGKCKLKHVINVATLIHREVENKYAEGFMGKILIERQQITKYCGEVNGLYSVIMNTSLWREIISTLRYLDFLKVDRDGLIIMSNLTE